MKILSKLVENKESYGYLKISNKAVMGATTVVSVICSYLNMHKLNNSHMQKHQMLCFCTSLVWYNSNLFSLKLHCFLSNRKFYCYFSVFQSLIKYSKWGQNGV